MQSAWRVQHGHYLSYRFNTMVLVAQPVGDVMKMDYFGVFSPSPSLL